MEDVRLVEESCFPFSCLLAFFEPNAVGKRGEGVPWRREDAESMVVGCIKVPKVNGGVGGGKVREEIGWGSSTL